MLFDVLALALLVTGWLIARRAVATRLWYALLPAADQPPVSSDEPWPTGRALRRYVDEGLDEVGEFLARRDPAVD